MPDSQKRKYFGTDGVRGAVGTSPLTADFALRLANAAGRTLGEKKAKVLIGKDTRLSGYLFESALEAGFVAAGVDVLLIGPLPTPGIAYMTKHLGCDLGVVISASHNCYSDNGIKFFNAEGGKISDETELAIERFLEEAPLTKESGALGRAERVDNLREAYEQFAASTFEGETLAGYSLVIDSANGAGYKAAPNVFNDLGANIVSIGSSPNGRNINDGCGATAPALLQLTVKGVHADAGIALDGDGDRLIMVDKEGVVVDGDQILYVLAKAHKEAGTLKTPVVGTVMSNLGLELSLKESGIDFKRTAVGDRHVLEALVTSGGILGSEPSGHILCLDKTTTGDGIIAALQVLSVMKKTGKSLTELAAGMKKFPQVTADVRVKERFDPESVPAIRDEAAAVSKELGNEGRVVLRASGTEPLIRIMVEAHDVAVAKKSAERIAVTVRTFAGL